MALFKKKRSPLTSSRLAERKRKVRTAKIIFYIIFIGLVVCGMVWFSRQPQFKIASVEVSGNVSVGTLDIQEIANRNISGYYFLLFSRSNEFIYPQKAIEGDIISKFPEISSVRISVVDNKMIVSVIERSPAYIWCKGSPEEKSQDCYFMDGSGYIFSQAPNFSGNVYFTYYGMISSDNPIRLSYMDLPQFESLNKLKEELEKNGIETVAENSNLDGVREFYLAQGGRIIFKTGQDPYMLASALDLVKSQTDVLNNDSEPLDYIDMRFGNKVYYKFVGDNAVQSSQ